MKKKILFSFFVLFLVVSFLFLPEFLSAYQKDIYREAEIMAEVREKIITNYVEDVPSEKILKGALQGMTGILDPYSEYLDEEAYKQLFESTEGEFIGIGIVISIEDGVLTVVSPVEGSPSARAGILAGDKIIAINGELTEGLTVSEAAQKLKGKKGTKLILSVIHEGSKVAQEITIIRDLIQIHSIKNAQMIDQEAKIGYFRLTKFNKHTEKEVGDAIENLVAQGMKSLIIDLRFNPGGLLDSAVDVVNYFITEGVIVYTKGKTPDSYKVFRATNKKSYEDLHLVVIINKRSASASEIVAGALQDYHRAIIVGNRSYGKGLVQTILRLRDGKSAIKLTTAKYYTPSGRSIQKGKDIEGGVLPDIQVPITDEEEKDLMQQFYETLDKDKKKSADRALDEAISVMKKQSNLYRIK
ncbi:MAG: S41 family peptidase [Candidatus Brocadiae bacterium]|nr:S41 family peptidase [Candidatus Brocadiia bacterium]